MLAVIHIINVINIITTRYHLVQGIYNYTPETNHVSRVCIIAFILFLQFMAHVMLFPMLKVCTFPLTFSAVCV